MPTVNKLTENAAKQAVDMGLGVAAVLALVSLAAPYSGSRKGFNARFERYLFQIHAMTVERVELIEPQPDFEALVREALPLLEKCAERPALITHAARKWVTRARQVLA